MIAIVMAGGKSERMGGDVEKPLIRMGDKTLLERVMCAINASGLETVVATSRHTPKTRQMAQELGLDIIETPGEGYVRDTQFILRERDIENALVVSADLPFITPALIQGVVERYEDVREPVCVVTPLQDYTKLGCQAPITINHAGEELVPVGINVVERTEGEDYIYKINGRQTLNINTPQEIEIAKRMLENG